MFAPYWWTISITVVHQSSSVRDDFPSTDFYSMPPLQTENRSNYGKTSRKFSCGHDQEDPNRPFPPPHRYGQHTQIGNEIRFHIKCMQCDLHEVCQQLKNLRKDADVDLVAVNRVKDATLRSEMKEKVIDTTRVVQEGVVADFEARWNEKSQRRGYPGASPGSPAAYLRLSDGDRFLDIDKVTTLEELMAFMEEVNRLSPGI
jgi:hypothetical protein